MRNKEETGTMNPSKYGTIAPEATISDLITPTTPTRLNTNSKTLPRHQMLQKPNHSNIITTTTTTEAVATTNATTKTLATTSETTTVAATCPAAPTILNGKNMLTKLNAVGKTVTSMNDFVKIAPKSTGSIITATAAQTSSATTIAKSGNKTAIKATNGQIYYIQKSSSGVPTIRLATPPITTSMTSGLATAKKSTTLTTTTTSAGVTVTAVSGTNAVGATYGKSTTTTTPTPTRTTTTANKAVAIQMLRSADGTLIPLKQTPLTTLSTIKATASTATTVSTAKNALTLSSAMSTQIACKKIITNSGQQVLVKTALKPSTTLTLTSSASSPSATAKTTVTTSLTSTTTTTPMITPKTTITLSSTTKLPTVKTQGDSHETTKSTKLQKILPITSSAIAVVNNGALATTTTAATNKSEPSGSSAIKNKLGSKIVVQGADGKQIVVSNSQLIKLSPKPTASSVASGGKDVDGVASNSRANTISTGGHLKAIHIPGKSGLQYVRVLPNSKLSSLSTAENGGVAVKKSGVMSDEIGNALTTTEETTQSTTTTTTTVATETSSRCASAASVAPPSSVKLINSESQKFTVVRTSTGTTKMLLTQSPKNFTPITSKVQKTIVTVPTLRKISTTISTGTGGADSNAVSGVCKVNLLNKQTISDINAQIQRITSGEPETKKTANGSRIVVMPRSMLRSNNNNNNNSNIGSNTNSNNNNNHNNSTNNNNMLSLQKSSSNVGENNIHRSDTTSTSSSSSPRKLYSVLKPNVAASTVSDVGDGSTSSPHPVELKTNAELKSLIICGQARALMGHQQQEQQKAQQMLQKQRLLHQQQQQLQQQMQRQRQQQQQIDKQRKHQQQQQHLLLKQQQQQQQQHMKMQQQLKQQQQNHLLKQSDQQQPQHEQQSYNNGTLLAVKIKQEPPDPSDVKDDVVSTIVRRKHCNCTKSQCLKLYCDCFANGEFCQDCNCKDCFNNLQYEDERQKAIKNCLERNPSAFKPKITTAQDHGDMRLHNKGCNCKRSGCLKNYCECYEAKIPCSSNCRCFGCRNVEDRPDLDLDPIDSKILATLTGGGSGTSSGGAMLAAGQKRSYDKVDKSNKQMLRENNSKTLGGININNEALATYGLAAPSTQPPEKQQCNFITQEVIDATIQCMISQADECEKNGLPAYQTEKMVMEELGRCLVEIIDFSIRNTDTSYTQD